MKNIESKPCFPSRSFIVQWVYWSKSKGIHTTFSCARLQRSYNPRENWRLHLGHPLVLDLIIEDQENGHITLMREASRSPGPRKVRPLSQGAAIIGDQYHHTMKGKPQLVATGDPPPPTTTPAPSHPPLPLVTSLTVPSSTPSAAILTSINGTLSRSLFAIINSL